MTGFRGLAVYRNVARLSDELRWSVETWPQIDVWTVGVQLVRTADSVGANFAEAAGRWSYRDRRRILVIARGSACELEHWLERAKARKLALPDQALRRASEVSRMLNGLWKRTQP